MKVQAKGPGSSGAVRSRKHSRSGVATPRAPRSASKALERELERCRVELAEALEQQAAAAEILRVISASPGDPLPVFRIIVSNSMRLCEANFAAVFLLEGERLRSPVHTDVTQDFADYLERGFGVSRETTAGRAVLQRAPVQVADILVDPEFVPTPAHRSEGLRTVLAVPLLSSDRLLGVITIWRHEVRRFSDRQIALLNTFADQAVIAIENVRLFNEVAARTDRLEQALRYQTATSEVLSVISRSPTDVAPVFDTIVRNAVALCGGLFANVFTFDGERVHYVASANAGPEYAKLVSTKYPMRPDRSQVSGRVILDMAVVTIEDAQADSDYDQRFPAALGWRRMLGVPMLRAGRPLGVIVVGWADPGPVPATQELLLKTFADQAVIAIENARLFEELQARNIELTGALEQQTATGEVLRVISRSTTDVQPVFDTIATAALKLCAAASANVFTFDGELLHAAAIHNLSPTGKEAVRRIFPRPPDRGTAAGRAVAARALVAIHDTLADGEDYALETAQQIGFRSVVGVPLMRDGVPVGAIAVGRFEPGPFPEQQLVLLQTFADQAVIAIENDRLFRELQERTAQLTRSVEQLRALSEVGQAVTSTLDLETVLSTIVSRATQLAASDGGLVYEYDEQQQAFQLRATDRVPAQLADDLRAAPMPKGEGAVGRLALSAEPLVIRDILDSSQYQSRVRDMLIKLGYRSLLAVPLLREDRLLGGLIVQRKSPGDFERETVELLQTFATQSALAIQNARLFREIEDKSRQLEVASRHKSSFLANMSHELRTPLNAIIGFTRIVMRRSQDALEPKQFENLEKILASGQHLLSLINAILDLAKVESGRVEVVTDEISPAPLLEQCARMVEPLLKEGVTLVRDVADPLPPMLVDEEKLRQIVFNLLSNATKFTEAGTVTLRAHAADGRLVVAVADTGIGIAADKMEVIFEQFEQAHADSTRLYGGTGLGLAIARQLARLMRGDIGVESRLSVGSTFTLNLPLRYAAPGT